MRLCLTAALLAALTMPVAAQWLNHPTPGIPRTADGKPNLMAPTPRTHDGKPDFTGLWSSPVQIGRPSVDPSDMQPWPATLHGAALKSSSSPVPRSSVFPAVPRRLTRTRERSSGSGYSKRQA